MPEKGLREKKLGEIAVAIKGAGEMASGVAWRLWQANFRRIFMLEIAQPLAVRRKVSFCEAVRDGEVEIEAVRARKAEGIDDIQRCWQEGVIAVCIDPQWKLIGALKPEVCVDAIVAKRNLGTNMQEAPLVIGLGPGFEAKADVHMVIETNRGHDLGRVILSGSAEENTGTPGNVGGFTWERVLRAPCAGIFTPLREIGEQIQAGETVGRVAGMDVTAEIAGVLRGLIRGGTEVPQGMKLGDVDSRAEFNHCFTVSDKALAIGGGVLEAILRTYNR